LSVSFQVKPSLKSCLQTHESAVLSEVLGLMTSQSDGSSTDDETNETGRRGLDYHSSHKHTPWWKPLISIFGFQLLVGGAGIAWRKWNRQRTRDIKRI
jgi:hypothetical protein